MLHFPELLGRLLSTGLFYFKSGWEDVRAAAPMLTGEQRPSVPAYLPAPAPPPPLTLLLPTGFLVLHVEAEHRPQVDLEQLTAGEPRASPAPTPQPVRGLTDLWAPGGTK